MSIVSMDCTANKYCGLYVHYPCSQANYRAPGNEAIHTSIIEHGPYLQCLYGSMDPTCSVCMAFW